MINKSSNDRPFSRMETQEDPQLKLHTMFFDAVHQISVGPTGAGGRSAAAIMSDVLGLIDHGNDQIPPLQLRPCPHEEDKEYCIGEGEKWWPTGKVIGAGRLQSAFEAVRETRAAGQNLAALARVYDPKVRELGEDEMLALMLNQLLDYASFHTSNPHVFDDGYAACHSLFASLGGASLSNPAMDFLVRPGCADNPQFADWQSYYDESVFEYVKEDYVYYRSRVHGK